MPLEETVVTENSSPPAIVRATEASASQVQESPEPLLIKPTESLLKKTDSHVRHLSSPPPKKPPPAIPSTPQHVEKNLSVETPSVYEKKDSDILRAAVKENPRPQSRGNAVPTRTPAPSRVNKPEISASGSVSKQTPKIIKRELSSTPLHPSKITTTATPKNQSIALKTVTPSKVAPKPKPSGLTSPRSHISPRSTPTPKHAPSTPVAVCFLSFSC